MTVENVSFAVDDGRRTGGRRRCRTGSSTSYTTPTHTRAQLGPHLGVRRDLRRRRLPTGSTPLMTTMTSSCKTGCEQPTEPGRPDPDLSIRLSTSRLQGRRRPGTEWPLCSGSRGTGAELVSHVREREVGTVKFRVERDVLAEAVTWTARTLPTRPPAPGLAGVRLEAAADGTLTLSTFDYEVSARSEVAAEVDEPGTVLVSGRLRAESSRALPGKPVDVVLDGTRVNVTCGSSRFTLLTMPVEDYPALPEMPAHAGSVDADAFAEAISQVTIAAGRDETLPLLTGVKLEISGEK